ncbi:peptidoglycan DD-metalloendopeptidase family protein [Glaciimonas sp. GG7]
MVKIRLVRLAVLGVLIATMAACSTPDGGGTSTPSGPGYYTVQRGDTLYSIGRKFKQNHRSIARWNKLGDVNGIDVGQVLRVAPPAAVGNLAGASPVTGARKVSPPAPPAANPSSKGIERSIDWVWPTEGVKTASFSSKKKGIEIAGKSGQPVVAASGGKVMYAGSGIRGYGNLLIVKHTSSLLSVYAHNQAILVKEGQMVSRGQKIAEMGKSDSSTVKLYFEIRRDGKPIDPSGVFPGR